MTRVAVLGTGRMGGAIAHRLKAGGFQVSVWDRTKSKAEALDVGRVADSPADATRDADVVVSMVTGPQAVREVYFGPAGVFSAVAQKTILEMSTAGPGIAQELAIAAKLNGARLIEAPVMGSVPAVRNLHEPTMFAIRDMLKDLDLGLALYQPVRGSPSAVPLTSLTRELFDRVASQTPELDLSAIVNAYSTNLPPDRQKEVSS